MLIYADETAEDFRKRMGEENPEEMEELKKALEKLKSDKQNTRLKPPKK